MYSHLCLSPWAADELLKLKNKHINNNIAEFLPPNKLRSINCLIDFSFADYYDVIVNDAMKCKLFYIDVNYLHHFTNKTVTTDRKEIVFPTDTKYVAYDSREDTICEVYAPELLVFYGRNQKYQPHTYKELLKMNLNYGDIIKILMNDNLKETQKVKLIKKIKH